MLHTLYIYWNYASSLRNDVKPIGRKKSKFLLTYFVFITMMESILFYYSLCSGIHCLWFRIASFLIAINNFVVSLSSTPSFWFACWPQILMGVLFLSLNLMRDCHFHLIEYKSSALFINHAAMAMSFGVTAINLLISAFDPTLGRFLPTNSGSLSSVSSLDSNALLLPSTGGT